jgi:hypothetical protein
MVRISRSLALVGGFCTLLTATAAMAQNAAPATGLGQSWPNATDVSASPHYHVYVFYKDGIRYFQVNDLNGNVRAAVAVANGVVLTLPIGLDSAEVTHSATAPVSSATETLYSDKSVTLTATPTQSGHDVINTNTAAASSEVCEPQDCQTSGITGQQGLPGNTQSGSN